MSGYFTNNPYQGTPYVRGADGRDVNGHEHWTVFCESHCPPAQAYPWALAEINAAARALEATCERDPDRDGGHFAPLAIVLMANEAGRELNAHKRYGWAPIVGAPCSVCGAQT